MRPPRVLIQAIVLVVAGVYLVSYWRKGLPTTDLFAPIGAAGSAASLFVLGFDHRRLPVVGRRLSGRPDVRGTWRGALASDWEDPESGERTRIPEVYLVVRQTYWSLSAVLITRESKSCTTTATIEGDGCGQYQLVAQYRNTPRASVRPRSQVHHGSFKLDIAGDPVDWLEGYYWTDARRWASSSSTLTRRGASTPGPTRGSSAWGPERGELPSRLDAGARPIPTCPWCSSPSSVSAPGPSGRRGARCEVGERGGGSETSAYRSRPLGPRAPAISAPQAAGARYAALPPAGPPSPRQIDAQLLPAYHVVFFVDVGFRSVLH